MGGSRSDLVYFTSALRYPIFERGKNYTGSGITPRPLLLDQLDAYFATDCQGLFKALFIPLGTAAQQACDRMVSLGKLAEKQVMRGLPHPSGANAERIAYFLGRKARERLSSRTRPEPLNAGLAQARKIIDAWAA